MIRVLLADDHELIRTGFAMILATEVGIEVVGEAADGDAAIAAVAELVPDIVLMDVQMPGVDGIAATREIVAAHPGVRVVILTTFDDDEYLFAALRAGACGFLLKNCPADELVAAVGRAADGHALLAPEVTARVIARSAAVTTAASDRRIERLTERERDVLVALARGRSNAEIGESLFVSAATVKSHVSSILAKLEARDRVQAVIVAYESGLMAALDR